MKLNSISNFVITAFTISIASLGCKGNEGPPGPQGPAGGGAGGTPPTFSIEISPDPGACTPVNNTSSAFVTFDLIGSPTEVLNCTASGSGEVVDGGDVYASCALYGGFKTIPVGGTESIDLDCVSGTEDGLYNNGILLSVTCTSATTGLSTTVGALALCALN